jgi:hypothetical protein
LAKKGATKRILSWSERKIAYLKTKTIFKKILKTPNGGGGIPFMKKAKESKKVVPFRICT